MSLLQEQAKLLFLRMRNCPQGLKEEIIRRIRPGINMHSSDAKTMLKKFSIIMNSDRDKLNKCGQISAKTIIEAER